MKRGFGYYCFYVFSEVFGKGAPFILLPFLTSFLKPYQYGQLVEFTSVYNFLFIVGACSVQTFIRKKYFEESDLVSKYYLSSLFLSFVTSVILLIILWVLSNYFGFLVWLELSDYFLILLSLLAMVAFRLFLTLTNSRLEAKNYMLWNLLLGGLNLTLSFSLVLYFFDETTNGRVLAVLLSPIFAISLLFLLKLKKINSISYSIDFSKVKEQFMFYKDLVIHQVATWFRMNFDKLVISSFFTLEVLGGYSVSAQLSMALFVLYTALNQALAPKLLSALKSGGNQYALIIRKSYLLFLVIFIGSLILTISFGSYFLGGDYFLDKEVVAILSFSYFINGLYLLNTHSIIQGGLGMSLSKVSLVSSLISVIFILLTIDYFDVMSVVYASLISSIIIYVFTWGVSRKAINTKFKLVS